MPRQSDFPKFIPKVMEGCVVIPLITLVLTYSVYISVGWMVIELTDTLERQIHMMTLNFETEVIAIAIIGVMAICYFVLSYLSAYSKQKRDAKALQIKETHGYVLTIDDQVDIEKAKTFNKVYKWAIFFGVIISGVITSLAMIYIFPDYLSSSAQIYGASFIASIVISVLLDKTVIETTANGEFEKVKSAIYETFRKVADETSVTVNNADIKNLQSLASQFASALASFGKQQ